MKPQKARDQAAPTPTIGAILMENKAEVSNKCDSYLQYYDTEQSEEALTKMRKENSKDVVNHYYDLATDFYEYGWGESFHFAPLTRGETREHAFVKHEYQLALRLGLKSTDKVMDMGCGIGGPARNIASFSEAQITGININDYQLQRAADLTKKAGLDHLIKFQKADFCDTPFPDCSFDKVYGIEATCHADQKEKVYKEAFRVLKPGGYFGIYEWIMTDKYDPNNAYHKKIKEEIMEGDGLPDIEEGPDVLKAMRNVGFEVIESCDLTKKSDIAWQTVLMPRWTVSDIKVTPLGRWATHLMLMGMELVGFAPKGAVKVHRMLCKGADGLVKGGKEGIFSPMFYVLARKPESASSD